MNGQRDLLCIASWGCGRGLGSLCTCLAAPLLPRTSQPICATAGLQGMAYVQVQASVTQPEKRQRWVVAADLSGHWLGSAPLVAAALQ